MTDDLPPSAAPPRPLPGVHTPTVSSFDDALTLRYILFSFRGRVPRRTWWLYAVLGPLLISAMAEMLLGIVGVAERNAESISSLLLLWPCAAVSAKRWHDRGRSGWWALLLFLPMLGLISTALLALAGLGLLWTLIENGLRRGTPGPNRFGAVPRPHL
jgi:uncharacterized membrane protein YhaH (DUF805 family)